MSKSPRALFVVLLLLASMARADETTPLLNPNDPAAGWSFDNGREFPGATGSLAADPQTTHDGQPTLRLIGDFTKGGGYVSAGRKLEPIALRELSMWVRNPNAERFTLRINDGTGQTHQIDLRTVPGDQWQQIVLPLERFFTRRGQADAVTGVAKYEYWGGAKDGKWHGPATGIWFLLGSHGDHKVQTLWLSDIQVRADAPAFKFDFDSAEKLPDGWTSAGGKVDVDAKAPAGGARSLRLSRTDDDAAQSCSAASPTFPVAVGEYFVRAACSADLKSPDNSYRATVRVECLDARGKVVDRVTVADGFGRHDWQVLTKRFDLPQGTVSARVVVEVEKATGRFWVNHVSMMRVGPSAAADQGVARVLYGTARLGNLFFPDDPRKFDVTVETRKPLGEKERTLNFVVRDYWGAAQAKPIPVRLDDATKKGDRWLYPASVDLAGVPLEVGRYYELHATAADLDERTSFAILPEAVTKRYKPEEVPFTSRNWDNRIPDYIRLTDRFGIRVCGLWGGWSAKAPYEPQAPALELCQQLGMGWLTNTPAATIEAGKRDYDETALREGVRHLIERYGKVRPLVINLGNEPHGTGERVKANVDAYKAIYEEVKKVDPTITVVATSVEPNEEYFKLGYGQWCDAFDFHIYESAASVRRTMDEYRALMQKYGVVKPLWSTELGLNSQGMPRLAVASEVIKKFTTFFAAGGTSCSWFGFLYPDAEGKNAGSSGDAHNVFDCRYSRYAPRLDAIAYYNAVNAIAIKKFVGERTYADGVHAFLFRDRENKSLEVLWADRGRHDVAIPLVGVGEVTAIRIDGSRRSFDAARAGVTLTVAEDPVMLLYEGGPGELPENLAAPLAKIEGATPSKVSRKQGFEIAVKLDGATEAKLIAPPFWAVERSAGDGRVAFKITPAADTTAHQADLTITIVNGGGHGELYWRAPVGE